MKFKLEFTQKIIPKPDTKGLFIVQKQWIKGGMIHTDDNQGKGYSFEEAQAKLDRPVIEQK